MSPAFLLVCSLSLSVCLSGCVSALTSLAATQVVVIAPVGSYISNEKLNTERQVMVSVNEDFDSFMYKLVL